MYNMCIYSHDINKNISLKVYFIICYVLGEPPIDPNIGILPPNNGTSGQGFVTFFVNLKEDVGTLDRIDAEAIIIFDQNEEIKTPPIFNTVGSLKFS